MDEKHDYQIEQILQEMRADYWRNLEAEEESVGAIETEYLIVHCGNNRYGLPAANCREVLKLPRLVRVPRLPGHLCGIFNLRGEIVAVTDLCPLLNLEAQVARGDFRLVVVEAGSLKTALLVEVVEGLISIGTEQIEALAEGSGAGARDLLSGKVVQDEGALVLINLGGLMMRPELVVDQKQQDESSL
jgi:purine-binding chemotaxis protein CheW